MKKKLKPIDDSQLLAEAKKDFYQYIDIDTLNQYTDGRYSNSSLLAMRSDWNRYIDFCYRKSASVFPPQTDIIQLFLESESLNRKYSSIRRYSITLSSIYRLLGEPDPLRQSHIRQCLMTLRLKKSGDQKQSDAFTSLHLELIEHKLGKSDKIIDLRDLAIFYIMFECALKRAELRELNFEQISIQNNIVTISLDENVYPLSEQASNSVIKWLSHIKDNYSPVFRAVDKHHNVSDKKLNDSSIFRIFRKAAELIGKPELRFSGQSARIGAAQDLHKRGEKINDIQIFGRWNSPVMPFQYIGNSSQSKQHQLRYKKFKPWD